VTSGLIACLAALAVALVLGFAWRRNNGRMREPRLARLGAVRASAAARQPESAAAAASTTDVPAMTAIATENGAAVWMSGSPQLTGPQVSGPHLSGSPHLTEPQITGPQITVAEIGQPLGSRATLLQFSTAFCAPCRATRRILGEVAGMTDGVAHIEIDAESRLDLVRLLDVRRTPTVFVLGPDGRIVKRASGQPRKADVIAALGAL